MIFKRKYQILIKSRATKLLGLFLCLLIFRLIANAGSISEIEAFNRAVSAHKNDSTERAFELYKQLSLSNDSVIKSKALYNMAHIELEKSDYSKAKELFRQAILADPDNFNAKYNYIYCREKDISDESESSNSDENAKPENQTTMSSKAEDNYESILEAIRQGELETKRKLQNERENASSKQEKAW